MRSLREGEGFPEEVTFELGIKRQVQVGQEVGRVDIQGKENKVYTKAQRHDSLLCL